MNNRVLLLSFFMCFAFHHVCLAAPEREELTEDSIIALASEGEFDMDEYMAQLESMAGDDYKRMQALQERFGVDERQREEAELAKKQRLWLICILSLVVALIPSFSILKKVISGEIQPAGTQAVLKTIGVLLGWGIVLFVFNFGWMWVLLFGGTKIMGAVLGVLLFAFVIYAAVSVSKYYKKIEKNN